MAKESSRLKRIEWALLIAIASIPIFGGVAICTLSGYFFLPRASGFGGYYAPAGEFHSAKTLWDWLDLLIVPAVLAVGGALFTWTQRKTDREAEKRRAETQRDLAAERERENALHAYLDKMTELMLEKDLRSSKKVDGVRYIARARTLTTLHRLDGMRKGVLLQFLCDSGLINKEVTDSGEVGEPPVYLFEADLRGANLTRARLNGANLAFADLRGADLRWADLSKADLTGARLQGADMRRAVLVETDLHEADLSKTDLRRTILRDANLQEALLNGANLQATGLIRANLRSADLNGADLRGAKLGEANLHGALVTSEQLGRARLLARATMPDGTQHE